MVCTQKNQAVMIRATSAMSSPYDGSTLVQAGSPGPLCLAPPVDQAGLGEKRGEPISPSRKERQGYTSLEARPEAEFPTQGRIGATTPCTAHVGRSEEH